MSKAEQTRVIVEIERKHLVNKYFSKKMTDYQFAKKNSVLIAFYREINESAAKENIAGWTNGDTTYLRYLNSLVS